MANNWNDGNTVPLVVIEYHGFSLVKVVWLCQIVSHTFLLAGEGAMRRYVVSFIDLLI